MTPSAQGVRDDAARLLTIWQINPLTDCIRALLAQLVEQDAVIAQAEAALVSAREQLTALEQEMRAEAQITASTSRAYERANTLLECANRLAALRLGSETLAPSPAPDSWQPIATAPKDGTPILLWEIEGCVTVGHWTSDYTKPWIGEVHGEDAPWSDQDRSPIFDATHWMPLPAPPAVAGDAEPES